MHPIFKQPLNHHKLKIKSSGVLLLALLLLSACSFSLAEDITPPPGAEVPFEEPTQPPLSGPLYPLVKPNPAAAGTIYTDKCAPCHGTNGLGDGEMAGQLPVPPPALGSNQVSRKASPGEWYTMITLGNLERRMPPFSSLSDRQRWDLVAYLYSLSTDPEDIVWGADLYLENCAACHGVKADGKGPETGDLPTAPTNFTDLELMASLSDEALFQAIYEGVGSSMPAFAEQLSEREIWALSDYLRSLTFASQLVAGGTIETPAPQTPGPDESEEGSPTPEVAAGMGQIEGQVVSVSGGEIPSGLSVTLYGFDQMQQVFSEEAAVAEDGTFTFEQVPMPVGRAFLASTEVEGVAYSSDIAVAEAETSSMSLMLPYYETTTDTSLLTVDRLHLLFEYIDPDTLRVVEMNIISNTSDRIVVAPEEGQAVIRYDLPDQATNLQFQDGLVGERYIELEDGFGDLAVVRPGAGQHQVIYSYDLPYQSSLDFSHKVNLPVEALIVMLPEDGIKLEGSLLADMGTRDVQGIPYQMFTSESLAAGSDLAIDISGRPSTRGPILSLGSDSSLTIGLLAFGLVMIAAGGWLYLRARNGKEDMDEEELEAESLPADNGQDVDTLLDAILALDDQYKAGELPEAAYLKRREELKANIKDVMRQAE